MDSQRSGILSAGRYGSADKMSLVWTGNYAPAVAQGICVWCGFNGRELLKEKKEEK